MKRLSLVLDRLVQGKIAVAGFALGTVVCVWLIVAPLPWQHFPNVWRMLNGSWIYLGIMTGVVYTAISSLAARPGFPSTMLACVVVGLIWKYTALLKFLPFNFSRLLLIYGCVGMTAHCLRRTVVYLRRQPVSAGTVNVPVSGKS